MIKGVISHIINFFLAISIFCIMCLLILSNTIFNKQYIINILEKSNYYEKTYEYIKDEFSNYTMQAGLEERALDDICDVNNIKQEVNKVVDAVFSQNEVNTDTSILALNLDNKINEVLANNNIKLTSNEKEAIQAFENNILEIYKSNIDISENHIGEISKSVLEIQKKIKILIVILVIIILILAIIVLWLNKKILPTALMTAGIMSIFVKVLIAFKVQNILILTPAFSESLIELVNSMANVFCITGICSVIISLIVIIFLNKEEDYETK